MGRFKMAEMEYIELVRKELAILDGSSDITVNVDSLKKIRNWSTDMIRERSPHYKRGI
jgi:hypothetical protein